MLNFLKLVCETLSWETRLIFLLVFFFPKAFGGVLF